MMKTIAILFPGNLKSISTGGIDRYVKSIISYCDNYQITVYGICEENEYEIGKKYENSFNGKYYYFIPICNNERKPLSLYFTLSEIKWLKEIRTYDCVFLQRIEFALPFAFGNNHNIAQIIHGSGKFYEYSYGKIRFWIYSFLEWLSIIITSKTFVIMNNDLYGVPYYKKLYPACKNKFFFAINPIKLEIFRRRNKIEIREELGLPLNFHIILYAGRLINNPKRVMLIPDICKELLRRDVSCLFIIAGDGPDEKKLVDKVSTLELSDNFIFTGYIDNSEIIAKYNSAADAVINISMYEGTCTSNIEAVAAGIPIVSTDVGEIREIVSDNMNGHIINNTDDKDIICGAAEGIQKILNGEIKMNDKYLKYESNNAVRCLLEILL